MSIKAKVIADSVSPRGDRLTTFEVTYPRFILAEVNTHRAFSRNTASSRAIPVARMIEMIMNNPAEPVEWASERRGMQGGPEVDDIDSARENWHAARLAAIDSAQKLAQLGVHKSVVNRILEPFQYITSIISTSTPGLNNFFEQRDSELAQPEIGELAGSMKVAYTLSKPVPVPYSGWHLPYIDERDRILFDYEIAPLKRISAARCARVSYLTHDGRRSWVDDQKLYDRLVTAKPPHWSPLEHVATPSRDPETKGNFVGWQQLRHIVEDEL